MMFHESTLKKLRLALAGHQDQLDAANERVEKRTQALADAQEELGYAVQKAAELRANVADCERWLDFAALYEGDVQFATAFGLACLRRDAEMCEAKAEIEREQQETARPFKLDDRVIVNYPDSPNHGTYGSVSGTQDPGTEVLVEFDRDGTTHKFESSQLVHEDGA